MEWVASSRGSSKAGIEHASLMSPSVAGKFFTTSATLPPKHSHSLSPSPLNGKEQNRKVFFFFFYLFASGVQFYSPVVVSYILLLFSIYVSFLNLDSTCLKF